MQTKNRENGSDRNRPEDLGGMPRSRACRDIVFRLGGNCLTVKVHSLFTNQERQDFLGRSSSTRSLAYIVRACLCLSVFVFAHLRLLAELVLFPMQYTHHYNAARFSKQAESAAALCMQNLAQWAEAVDEIRTWPQYSPQPLRTLPGLARKVGVEQLFVKDESTRFGSDMASFKALGALYTVYKILADEVYAKTGVRPSSAELRTSKFQHITQNVTVCVATDGNQGRDLAYGAQVFGCRCVDYIHNHVSDGRADRMKKLGAVVIRINGEYEASVARAK